VEKERSPSRRRHGLFMVWTGRALLVLVWLCVGIAWCLSRTEGGSALALVPLAETVECEYLLDDVRFMSNGSYLTTYSRFRRTLRVFDVESGQKVLEMAADRVDGWACRADGSVLLFERAEGEIVVRELHSWKDCGHIPQEVSGSVFRRYSPDGSLFYVVDEAIQTAEIWDVETASRRIRLPGGLGSWAAAFSPDDQTLAVADTKDQSLRLIDTQTGRVRAAVKDARIPVRWNGPPPPYDLVPLAFSKSGGTLIVHGGHHPQYWDAQTGRALGSGSGERLDAVAISPQGDMAAWHWWDKAGSPLPTWAPQSVHEMALEEMCRQRWQLRLYRLPEHQPVRTIRGAYTACFLPGGKTLAAYHPTDNAVKIWDLSPRSPVTSAVVWLLLAVAIATSVLWYYRSGFSRLLPR
jgi:WD40 repeat protein